MKTLFQLLLFSFILSTFFYACKKDVRKGCTDPTATNYESLAKEDDGSCIYNKEEFTIWGNNKLGYWDNQVTGAIEMQNCRTNFSTIFLNPDSTFIPADTIIDNSVTPPDTTITPADTTITGDTYLLINSDSLGHYELIFKLLNKRDASTFKNGTLIFSAKLLPNNGITNFGVIINGNHLNNGGANCSTFLQSDPVIVSTDSLDTVSFKEISIPLTEFSNRYMQNIDLVFGIKGENALPNDSIMLINNIKWVANQNN